MEKTLGRSKILSEIKQLSELSFRWNAVFIVSEWLSIFLAVYLTEQFFNPVTYFVAVVWIGSRLHALGVLMHEAAHYRLFRNRKLNDFVGEVFLAWPITVTLKGYRNSHLVHHKYVNTKKDPDWEDGSKEDYRFPKTKNQMTYALLRNALGLGFYSEFTETAKSDDFNDIPRSLRNAQLGVFAAIVIASIILGFWKLLLLYWVVPAMTSLIFILYFRTIAEHYGMKDDSRNTLGTFWERILLAPYNVGLHLDHHLHPSVPWYNLRKLHAVLLADAEYRRTAHTTRDGYFRGVLRECTQFSSVKRVGRWRSRG
jgi:fatty acid desaturase